MTATAWNRQPPPGFQGLREDLPLIEYSRHLPHWRQDGATYFVAFRLADSLPQSKLRELEAVKREWAENRGISRTDCQSVLPRRIPREHWDAFVRSLMGKVEGWLDEGMGKCWMARPEISQIVMHSLQHFDNDHYELGCYVVMPNHVHGILRPLRPRSLPLEKILQGRKLHASRDINATLGRSGSLWEEESFDRIVRDEEHLYRCIHYVGDNPAKAGIPPARWRRWVRPSWKSRGWSFDD
jgi:REP element-mobilizing transposase RayT